MNDPNREAERWIKQAKNDLEFARTGFREGFYAQVCFLCQQVGEKAVKAVHYRRGKRFVFGHSIRQLLMELSMGPEDVTGDLETAGILDQFYVTARYPNGLPQGTPFEVYTKNQAKEAIQGAERLVALAEKWINP